jgi:hypothetical protein
MRTPSEVTDRGHRAGVVDRAPGDDHAMRVTTWTRTGVVMAIVVAPVVLIGGGLLVGRLAGWSWASAIFAGVVAYVVVVNAAWLISGGLVVRRELRTWQDAQDQEQERRVP